MKNKNEGETMTFKDKENEITVYLQKCKIAVVAEFDKFDLLYLIFQHMEDYIKFTYKMPFEEKGKLRTTCYFQNLTKEDHTFIINFIEFLENIGFKEE